MSSSSSTAVAASSSTTTTTTTHPEPKNEQEVISIYRQMQSDMQGLIQNLTKMEIELNEHRYVIYDIVVFFIYYYCLLVQLYNQCGIYLLYDGRDVMWGRMLWF